MITNVPRAFSINKFGEIVNEDAILVKDNLIAVSDGAGGGGVYADEWSRYLLNSLPDNPFESFDEFDNWVNGISDAFYDEHEELARQKGGIFLEKFYNEGSFATLAAIWRIGKNEYAWTVYGDSVAFAYNPATSSLQHSFSHLVDFNQPPHLISLISPLDRNGFKSGRFTIEPGSYVFVASDALAHYIIARYYSFTGDSVELDQALDAKSRNSSYVKSIQRFTKRDYYEDVILKLSRNATHKVNSKRILQKLYRHEMIGLDDYSLAFMPKTGCDTDYDDEYIAAHLALNLTPVDSRPAPRRLEDYHYVIDTLEDYEELRRTLAHYQNYRVLFRGHSVYGWPLIPSIMRGSHVSFEKERNLYPELKSFLISQGIERFRKPGFNEELFYLAIGRHLGLKSRLLDWSSGLDVSIDAFLLEEPYLNTDGALWLMFVPTAVKIEEGSPFDISDNDIHVFRTKYFSPEETTSNDFPLGLKRPFRQYGFFTATSEDVMNYPLVNIKTQNGILFVKMRITAALKSSLIEERNKKSYRIDRDTIVGYNDWYMGEDSAETKKIIDEMNKRIEGVSDENDNRP